LFPDIFYSFYSDISGKKRTWSKPLRNTVKIFYMHY
jgi:hypothetical protein